MSQLSSFDQVTLDGDGRTSIASASRTPNSALPMKIRELKRIDEEERDPAAADPGDEPLGCQVVSAKPSLTSQRDDQAQTVPRSGHPFALQSRELDHARAAVDRNPLSIGEHDRGVAGAGHRGDAVFAGDPAAACDEPAGR